MFTTGVVAATLRSENPAADERRRQSTNRARPKPIMRKTLFRRRSRVFAMHSEHCNSSFETWKYRMTILSAKLATRHRRWRI